MKRCFCIFPLVFSSFILPVLPQINDLNRRVSAIENFLNHLEQKVASPYDQVNPGSDTDLQPNFKGCQAPFAEPDVFYNGHMISIFGF